MKTLLQALIRLYSGAVSPFTGPSCRFHPTCSAYAHQALEQHGFVKGLFLTLCRFAKCHPFARKHEFCDPVPESFDWNPRIRYKRRDKNSETNKA